MNGNADADMPSEWQVYTLGADKIPKAGEIRSSGWYSGRE